MTKPERIKIKIKAVNKYFAEVTYGNGTPYIETNPFEMAKQHCILDATRHKSLSVPRFAYDVNKFEEDYPDLAYWFLSLSFHNAPTKMNYRSNPTLFKELVEPLDFSKPFNQMVVDDITAQFTGKEVKQEVNIDDIINAELSDD